MPLRPVHRFSPLAAALAMAFSAGAAAQVMPTGEVVKAGAATVSRPSASLMEINQASARAVIDWQTFSIGHGGHVNVVQPTGGAMLARVVGTEPSMIFGQLTANGTFALVNPNNIVFGPTAKIDTGSFIASTAGITNDNFMAGRLVFDQVTNRYASIINEGEISAEQGGLVALVAPGVGNSGTIRAGLGRVALASGHAYTLDLYGDQLVSFAVNDRVTERVTDASGRALSAFVDQSGRIEAAQIQITANAAKAVLDNVINMSGVLKAVGASQRGGEVVLSGEDITVPATGRIDVSGTSGGRAVLIADDHMKFDGIVDARGSSGPGGFVEVSGLKTLSYNGDVLMSAGGSLLFDPTELEINAAMALTLGNTMRAGANATATTSSGDLLVSAPIFGQGGANGGLTLTAGGSGSVIIDAVIVAGGPIVFNGTTEFRRSVFTNSGNITINGLGIINPRGDEVGFNPSSVGASLPEEVYTGAQFNAASFGPSRITGGAPLGWDAVNAKITIRTDAGSVIVNNGLVHFADPLAGARAAVSALRWFNGVSAPGSVAPARSSLPLSPLGWVGVNLVATGGSVTLNGTVGFSAGQIADALPSVVASPDTTFKMLAVGNTFNNNASGTARLFFNGAQSQGAVADITDPNHNGQLVPPSPSQAGLGSAAAYIAELNLVAPASSASSAANSATQEANAISQVVQVEGAGEVEVTGEASDGGPGPTRTADLGRGGGLRDAFTGRHQVANGGNAGPNADAEYFSETPFQAAERRRQQGQ